MFEEPEVLVRFQLSPPILPDSSMAEPSAVNRMVVGSSPTLAATSSKVLLFCAKTDTAIFKKIVFN